MKSRSLSKNRRALSAKNFANSEAKRLAASASGHAFRVNQPERAGYNNPLPIQWALTLAKKYIRSHGRIGMKNDMDQISLSEDAASESVMMLYANCNVASMQSLQIQEYLMTEIKKFISKEINEDNRYIKSMEITDEFFTPFVHNSSQDTYIEAVRCYSLLKRFPSSVKGMAYKMADGATLVEAAGELGLDLMTAMRKQELVRNIADRLVHDGMFAGIFSNLSTVSR